MSNLDRAVVARMNVGESRFEIFVDPDMAQEYRETKQGNIEKMLAVPEVFIDAGKGTRPTTAAIQKAFGTSDIYQIVKIILERGEVQLTTEQKHRMAQEKRKQVVALLARNCVDPRTNAPLTPQRIELAMDEQRIHIDAFKPADQQMDAVIKQLRLILPMKVERISIAVQVPVDYSTRVYGMLKEYGIEKEEWQGDGSLVAVVGMPAGLQSEFYDKLNSMTRGSVKTRILNENMRRL